MKANIKLYGVIGDWGMTAADIIAQLPADAKEIVVNIHSAGGSVGEALAIYHALRDHQAKVTTVVDGYAASSASFIMLAGDERLVHRNSIVFVHNPWTWAAGNADDLRKYAEDLDVHRDAILDIYHTRTGMAAEDISDMMDDEMYFRGVDAVDYGFATSIIDDEKSEKAVAALIKFDQVLAQITEGNVSRQKTRKEIEAEHGKVVADLADVQAKLAEIEALRVSEVEAVKAEMVQAIAERDEQIDIIKAERDELCGKIAEASAMQEELSRDFSDVCAKLSERNEQIESLKQKLENPAFADASLVDSQAAIVAQADAEADAAEAKASDSANVEEPMNELEAYEAMDAGEARRKFWADNRRKILSLMNKREKGEE